MTSPLDVDERLMARALVLARRGHGMVSPNPLVGSVIARDGEIIAEGWHARFGAAHAEAMALHAAGDRARGATAYVTLEPCNHYGKTPPCTEALIAAGVARVVYAVDDPSPIAAGGAERLAAAGIAVVGGVLYGPAAELNAAFLHNSAGATRPWITLKLALSLDGAVAGARGQQIWLTGSEARAAVQRMRAGADGVAVGIGTAIVDDPELTVRVGAAPRVAPVRVVFDRRGRLPLGSKLVATALDVPVLVVTDGSDQRGETELASRGVAVVHARTLAAALQALHGRGIRDLLVEGGAGLAGALIREGLVDRLITFHSPAILGAGAVGGFADLGPTVRPLRVVEQDRLGDDIITAYRFT